MLIFIIFFIRVIRDNSYFSSLLYSYSVKCLIYLSVSTVSVLMAIDQPIILPYLVKSLQGNWIPLICSMVLRASLKIIVYVLLSSNLFLDIHLSFQFQHLGFLECLYRMQTIVHRSRKSTEEITKNIKDASCEIWSIIVF